MKQEPESSSKGLKKLAKKNLKTMQKNRSHHPIREKTRVAKYGATSFARNIWLTTAAVLVMIITLVILFFTIVASVVLSNTANSMKEKIDYAIYFKPGTSEEDLSAMSKILETDENVKSISFTTSKQELDRFIEENKDDEAIIAGLKNEDVYQKTLETMPAVIQIKPINTDDYQSIKKIVDENPLFVKYVDSEYPPSYEEKQNEIATITSWARIAKNGGIILGVVFLVISILIIFNTVRMSIFSRREEIYMMKLVGANKSFIKGPFIVEAEICGVISGVIAASLSYVFFELLSGKLAEWGIDVESISNILESNQLVLVYAAFIAVGIIIGYTSARLAISKYLRKA